MTREGKIRLAIIGLGWVAQHRHIPSILRNPAFALVGFADKSGAKASALAQKHGLPFSSCAKALADISWLNDVDAVVIGAPPEAHAPLALEALARGKHVLTEKPFALTLAEAQAMVAAAQKQARVLAVVHNFQFSRAMRRFEKEMASGALGDIVRVAAVQLGNPARRLPSWHDTLPLGLFFDESPHFFYLLNKIAGPLALQKAHAVSSREGKNTPALVHLLYATGNDVPVTIDCQFEGALSEWFIRVSGTKATGILDIFRDIYVRLPNDKAHGVQDVIRTTACAVGGHLWGYVPNGMSFVRGRLDYGNDEVFSRFAQALREGSLPEGIDAGTALEISRLQSEALDALGGRVAP